MPGIAPHSGLYFGTFNPVHTGHLMIAQAALRQFSSNLRLERITFIPAGNPPHRHHEADLLDARHRFNMVQRAMADNPAFQVCDIELKRDGKSYTIDTLRRLIEQGLVQTPVPLIIGSDALANLASWREPEALIEAACFLQAPRPGVPGVESIELNGRTVRLNTRFILMPMLSISSSWVREILKELPAQATDGLRYFLPEPVRRYIRDNGLYGSQPSPF